jgi:hypothetical protein
VCARLNSKAISDSRRTPTNDGGGGGGGNKEMLFMANVRIELSGIAPEEATRDIPEKEPLDRAREREEIICVIIANLVVPLEISLSD